MEAKSEPEEKEQEYLTKKEDGFQNPDENYDVSEKSEPKHEPINDDVEDIDRNDIEDNLENDHESNEFLESEKQEEKPKGRSNDRIKCEHCDKTFLRKRMKEHVNRMHNTKLEQHPCSGCSKIFKTKDEVQRHFDRVHDPTKVQYLHCD